MIKVIKSKVDPTKVMHIVFNPTSNDPNRFNISDESQILQAAAIRLRGGQTFSAHKPWPTERTTIGTQESWIVVNGAVDCVGPVVVVGGSPHRPSVGICSVSTYN